MSIGAANTFTRNVWKPFVDPDIAPRDEAQLAKLMSLVVKVGALVVILAMPTAQPAISAQAENQRVNRPRITAGKICTIHTPPSSCRSIANFVGMARMTTSAPTLTTRLISLASCASCAGAMFGSTNGFQTLRVKVLAAPIPITAAGTSAPMAMPAKAKPANHPGNIASKSRGTAACGSLTAMPAASAM